MSDGWTFDKEGWETGHKNEDPPPGMIAMHMMTGAGDIRKIWNAANEIEVEDAKRSFDHLVKEKRYLAFCVNPEDNTKGTQMREFDPKAGKMILVPPIAGG